MSLIVEFESEAFDFNKIVEALEITCYANKVYSKTIDDSDYKIYYYVGESYFLRTNSTANVTIQIVVKSNKAYASLVTSSGGGGVLNISWGVHDSLASNFRSLLERQGFKEIKVFSN